MKRRNFILKAGAAGAMIPFAASCSSEKGESENGTVLQGQRTDKPLKNWIWVGPDQKATEDDWVKRFESFKSHGIDSVLVEIFNGSKAFYTSEFLPMGEPILERALAAGKKTGMEIHAWMWTMPCLIPEIIEEHPEWYNVNAKGESSSILPAYVPYYKFLCPSRSETRAFVERRVKELAAFEGLAGVHLDYVRHPDAILPKGLWSKYDLIQDKVYPEFDYCYCDHCRSTFKAEYGIDPLEIEDPTANKEWMQFRWDAVSTMVNEQLVPAAKEQGKMITAAVFPGPTLAKQMVRQDWGTWNLDAFLPMLYHSFYEAEPTWVEEQTSEGVDTIQKSQKLYSGIYVPGIPSKEEFRETLVSAQRGGAAGVSLFGMNEDYWEVFSAWEKPAV